VRNTFVNELTELAKTNDRIVLVIGDLGYNVIEVFADTHPDRFFNAGVAEQNMMSMCAGLASEGFHVFAYSIANFSTFRCAEQLRNDVDYHRLPVTAVSIGGGVSYGTLGYSHHAVQDFALIRSMPNMLIAAPGDPFETIACTRYLVENPQPSYLRLGKGRDPKVHTDVPVVSPGQWVPVREGSTGSAVLSTGGALPYCAKEFDVAHQGGSSTSALLSMPLWGAAHKSQQAESAKQWETVTTAEDHLLDAGFGSWMMEALAANDPSQLLKMRTRGLRSEVSGNVGTQNDLMSASGFLPI
jgi:transketolase